MEAQSAQACGSLEIAWGARATEEHLLSALAELRRETRARPELLARPVRILVPSTSLRLHVCERIVQRLGSMAGVTVQTLHGVTLEILQAVQRLPVGSDRFVELLAGRAAREERVLREDFEPLLEGYGSVAGSVIDLLDAGLEEASTEALQELIDEIGFGGRPRERARSILRVAGRVHAELEAEDAGGRAERLRRARELVEVQGEKILPTRMLFIHGFADVTGRAKDLLQALATRLPTRFLLDLPRDPGDESRPDRGVVFAERLRESLEGALGSATNVGTPSTQASPELFAAPGEHAEVREVARRVRGLLDAGAVPERIGIVARNLLPYRAPLRRHLDALAIPFSALRTQGPLDAPGRRIIALAQLVREGPQCPVERWLDATGSATGSAERRSFDLRLALRASGAARLRDVASLDIERHAGGAGKSADFALPMRRGVQPGNPEDGTRFRAPHRRMAAAVLRDAIADSRALIRHIEEQPRAASPAQHLERFADLRRALGWESEEPAEERIAAALAPLETALGTGEITLEEFGRFLESALNECAPPPLCAGGGAGVQVLDAMESRARTFEHLFLMGLNRDVFPRPIGPDPLLPDELRGRITEILPDIPIKSRGRNEDRYLFAQLYSAAEHLTLSWLSGDEDGKTRTLSPLVERILGEGARDRVRAVPPLVSPAPEAEQLAQPHTAHEFALLAALHGGLDDFEAHLPALFWEADGCTDATELARTRRNILAAFEGQQRAAEAFGPWLGFVGAQDEIGIRPDPRIEAPFVTNIEAVARCPWQSFLKSFLRLERTTDPWEALPGIEPYMLGNVVHNVLRRIDERSLGTDEVDLEEAVARDPQPIRWPAPKEFEGILTREADRELRKTRSPDPGWVRFLAECARPYCDEARKFMEEEGTRLPKGSGVLGVEVLGEAHVPCADGRELRLVFRTDRVERQGADLVLSDYKTGKPVDNKTLLKTGIPRAGHLQPVTYLLAGLACVEDQAPVRGRYLFLGPDVEEREVALTGRPGDQFLDLGNALGTIVDGWLAGTFFPRLVDASGIKAPATCDFCEVKEACLWGDSGARAALVEWGRGTAPDAEAATPMRALFELAERRRQPKKKSAASKKKEKS